LVLVYGVLCQVSYNCLSCLSVFLSLQSIVFNLVLSVLFAVIPMILFLDFRREDGWRGQNFIEVLELLPSLMLVRITDGL